MFYLIRKTHETPGLDGQWDGPVWRQAATLEITHFHPESSDHRPITQARALYDGQAIYIAFRVQDRFVRCQRGDYQDHVCRDSCVEFFVRPKPDKGYLNFEVNCGGALLLSYIEDATRTADGFRKFTHVPWEVGRLVRIWHSMPNRVEPEIAGPVTWNVEYAIPRAVLETYVGALGDFGGQEWRANFYKCADDSSHPHWAAWAPIGEQLNFHQPDKFAAIRFEG